jgi:hypothetical protein
MDTTSNSQLPVPALCKSIKALVAKGDHAATKAEQFYIAAGKHLVELKARCPKEWEKLANEKIGIGRSRAYEYIQLADGKKSLADLRASDKAENDRRQAKIKSTLRGQAKPDLEPEPQDSEDDDQSDDTGAIEDEIEQHFTDALLIRADQARQLAADQERQFQHYSGKVKQELVRAACVAANAWDALAERLERQISAQSEQQQHDDTSIPQDGSIPPFLRRVPT